MKNLRAIILTITVMIFSNKIYGQDPMRLWMSYRAQIRVTKEWRISAGQSYLFSERAEELSSTQNVLNIIYRLNSKVNFGMGFQTSKSMTNLNQADRNRVTARFNLANNIENYRISHSFRAEWHSPQRSKYEYRLRYGFRIHNRKLRLPLKARPFITNEFHYYLSGDPLWYRDDEGERLVRQAPRGVHAHRITLGVRIRPFRRFYTTLSFMRQTEFNAGNKYRSINVVDPRNGRVRRRFNNFNVINISTSYRINLDK
ncbi:MAG: DUF2490 domain-containing protein [Bacteroidota bacterium]